MKCVFRFCQNDIELRLTLTFDSIEKISGISIRMIVWLLWFFFFFPFKILRNLKKGHEISRVHIIQHERSYAQYPVSFPRSKFNQVSMKKNHDFFFRTDVCLVKGSNSNSILEELIIKFCRMTSMVKNIIQRKKSDFYSPQCSLLTSENEYITFDKRLPAPRSLHRHTYTGYTFSSFNYLKWSLLVLTNDLSLQNYLETSRPGGDMSFIDKIPNWFSLLIEEKIHGS